MWQNWSGSVRFAPRAVETPRDEAALVALVQRVAEEGGALRPVGSGHSSSALVETDDTLVSLANFTGIERHDLARGEATVGPGSTLIDLGRALREAGLAMENLGDVATQTIAGVISTGTHGSGKAFQNLSAQLIGGRIVTGTGEVRDFGIEGEPDLVHAAQVALGALWIFSALRLRLVPRFQLTRREWCGPADPALDHFDELLAANRNFDFYWYPHNDKIKIRALNPPGTGQRHLDFSELIEEKTGWSDEIIPKHSHIATKFEEMEYAVAAEVGLACFAEIRQRVLARHRDIVDWRLLTRYIAPDDGYLSPAHGRPTLTISLHQHVGRPYWGYFRDIEPIFRAYGGRPHWGKKHTLTARDLQPLYPHWSDFRRVRQEMDPHGVFLTPYLRDLLGLEEHARTA